MSSNAFPLGFNLVNLIVPGEPVQFDITGMNGIWTLTQAPNFEANREAINSRVTAAATYIAEHPDLGLSKSDVVLDEFMSICLAASYLSSNTVTTNGATPHSRISFIRVGDGFPRAKGITTVEPVVNSEADFIAALTKMLGAFNTNKADYHIDVLIQYWLDLLACWSLENMFMGACTMLEILKQCEIRRTGSEMHFYDAIVSLSTHHGLPVLNRDWLKMRNDLVHEGHLAKVRFAGKTKQDCINVCEDVMDWLDKFVHVIHGLGPVQVVRFGRGSLADLNSYTTW